MNIVELRNIGALVSVLRSLAFTALTAAGSGDNTAVNGVTIDRAALNMPGSAVFSTIYTAVLAATKSLSLTTLIQDSADGTNWATYLTVGPTVVATSAGGGTVSGQSNLAINLRSARRFVRVVSTPDLSASGTDTATIAGVVVLGGESPLPAL